MNSVGASERARSLAEAFSHGAATIGLDEVADGSELSVFRLDAFVARGWPEGPDEDTFRSVVPTMGAYLGEMMVQHLGGEWVSSAETSAGLAVRFVGGPIDPFKPVEQRLRGDPQAIAQSYVALRAILRGELPRKRSLRDRMMRRT